MSVISGHSSHGPLRSCSHLSRKFLWPPKQSSSLMKYLLYQKHTFQQEKLNLLPLHLYLLLKPTTSKETW